MKNILKTLLILIITLILITTYVSVNASVAQDIYSSCEQKVIDNVKYYKLTSVAGIHKLKVQWSDAEKSVTTSYNGRNIVFNTVNDIVYINGERHYFGDIVLHNGFTYIPEDSITIFGEGYTAYQLNNSSNIKYVNGKITRIDIDANDKLTVTTLKKYDFNQSLYFCVEEFAEMYRMTTKVAEGDNIMITNGKTDMYFHIQTDAIMYKGTFFTCGDIFIKDGKHYAPDTITAFILEAFLPDFTRNENTSEQGEKEDKYTTYIFDNTDIKYVSLKELSDIEGYKYQYYYVNKYAEVKAENISYFVLVPTNIIMKGDSIYNNFKVKEENDIVYIEYDALAVFGLIDDIKQPEPAGTINMGKDADKTQVAEPVFENKPDSETVTQYIPIRDLAQKVGATVEWNDKTFCAILTVKDVKYVFDTRIMKIFVNEVEMPDCDFRFEGGITLVNTSFESYINSSSVLHKALQSEDLLIIKSPNAKIKTHYPLNSPDRIVVDLLNIDKIDGITQKGLYLKAVRVIQDGSIRRLVVDLSNKAGYQVKQHNGYIEIKISGQAASSQQPVAENKNAEVKETPKNEMKINVQKDKIGITVADYKGYTVKRISDPDRLEIFIPHTCFNIDKLIPAEGSRYIKSINVRADKDGTNISMQLNGQSRYEISEKSKTELVIDIYSQKIINMSYHNAYNRKYIKLKGLSLSDQSGKVHSNVKITNNDLITEISFVDPTFRLTTGVLYVNDEYIEKIQIRRNEESVRMTIYAKQPLRIYMNSARSSYTNINFIPLNNPYSGCVVIDAGHGGFDPGAVAQTVYESKINLSIAKKVEKLLLAEGIKVFMTRDTDDYVGLYERADIANNLNASLFVSIHSNAFTNSSLKGIMTLVYPVSANNSKITGKSLGRTIQRNLVNITGAADRGVIDRPNLVVLNSTKMPAALVECGFMTNLDELKALQSEEYQDILARGIAKGILDTLNGK